MADNIQYLNYGDLLIELLALMNTLANQVNKYVSSQPWSLKRKDLFMSAYSDLVNRGISGASNETGLWALNVGGAAIPWDTMDKKSKEMYQEAAYFILQQMAGLPTKASIELKLKEEEELKLKLLPLYDNNRFQAEFGLSFLNRNFGGNKENYESQWNELDPRDETGLRGRKNRAKMLADSLDAYSNSLEEGKYNFEGGPFSDLNDLKTKILNAVVALRTDDISDDSQALNALGLNPLNWFYNGSGDDYIDEYGRTVPDANGKPYTYGGYLNYLKLQEKTKLEEEAKAAEEKLKALDSIKIYTSRGRKSVFTLEELSNKYNGLNKIIETYLKKPLKSLTLEENDELVSLFLQAYDRGKPLSGLSDEEWELMKSKFPAMQDSDRNSYRKISGLNNIFYNINNKNLILFDNGTLDINDSESQDFLKGLSDKDKKDAELLRLIFEGSGLSGEDIADIAASFVDLAGIGATFIPVIGNVAGAATGAAGSLTHFGADWSRDGLDWGDVRRLGVNLAFDAATLIPGFGTAAKAGKLAKFLLPKVPYIIAGIGAVQGLANGSEIINSFKKLSNPSTVTVEDLLNMAQGIALLAGGVNVSRGIYLSRLASKNLKPGTTSEPAKITTRNGREIKLNESEYNTLNSKNATREAKQLALESAAQRSGTPLESTDGIIYKGRSLTHPLRSNETTTEVEGLVTPKAATEGVNVGEIRAKNKKWIEDHPLLAKILPGRTTDAKVNWTNEGMYIRGWEENSNPTSTSNTLQPILRKSSMSYFPEGIESKELKELQNTFNTPEYKLRRETKIPKFNTSHSYKLPNGSEYSVLFNGQNITVTEVGKPTFKLLGTLHELKLKLARWIDRRTVLNNPQLTRDSAEWKSFVLSIKDLKRKGFLFKLGGKLTDTQIDNFLKKYRI